MPGSSDAEAEAASVLVMDGDRGYSSVLGGESEESWPWTDHLGAPLPRLRGFLKKKSRSRKAWEWRYFYLHPATCRLYCVTLQRDHPECTSGVYAAVTSRLAAAYHRFVSGEDGPSESWVDLRLVPEVKNYKVRLHALYARVPTHIPCSAKAPRPTPPDSTSISGTARLRSARTTRPSARGGPRGWRGGASTWSTTAL